MREPNGQFSFVADTDPEYRVIDNTFLAPIDNKPFYFQSFDD
jgi:hypothetical protein